MELILGTPFVYSLNLKPYVEGKRGIPKYPVDSVIITQKGILGDYNKFREEKNRGLRDIDKNDFALLLLPQEVISDLRTFQRWPVNPGDLGENITTRGISYESFSAGQVYQIGRDIRIEITQEAHPCGNLKTLDYIGENRYFDFKEVIKGRRGWYSKVLKKGNINVGDNIYLID